jgi:signal transduction histidine kinase
MHDAVRSSKAGCLGRAMGIANQGRPRSIMPQYDLSVLLAALASYLHERRGAILAAWQRAVDLDPKLTTSSTLSRAQFNDHIPDVLESFEQKLGARRASEEAAAEREQKASAADHGLIRWQQGYIQHETMLEWGHLQLCLLDELETYAAAHPESTPAMIIARRELALLCGQGVSESADHYARMQQAEAASRVADLERALAHLNELEAQRAENWREATHDLRGSVGVITNATAIREAPGVPEATRLRMSQIVQRGLASLSALLNDLTSLARLEAGQEKREVAAFDAAAAIGDLCASAESVAAARQLFLVAQGPRPLPVEGDAVKTQRIAQNLLLNAIKYTDRGGVKVTWEDAGPDRWTLCVQDTGRGFEHADVPPLAVALKEATEEARDVEEHGGPTDGVSVQAAPAPTLPSRSSHRDPATGEGIGLSIVKRLCELLDATLELETATGRGTTFRVVFPRRYARR